MSNALPAIFADHASKIDLVMVEIYNPLDHETEFLGIDIQPDEAGSYNFVLRHRRFFGALNNQPDQVGQFAWSIFGGAPQGLHETKGYTAPDRIIMDKVDPSIYADYAPFIARYITQEIAIRNQNALSTPDDSMYKLAIWIGHHRENDAVEATPIRKFLPTHMPEVMPELEYYRDYVHVEDMRKTLQQYRNRDASPLLLTVEK